MKNHMCTVSSAITIERPIEEVFVALTEPRYAVRWISMVFDAEIEDNEAIRAGTRAWYTVKLFGHRMRIEGRWERYEPPYESVFVTTFSPVALRVIFRCREHGAGTHAELISEWGNSFLAGLTPSFISNTMSKTYAHDLALLKTYLEGTPNLMMPRSSGSGYR